MESSPEMSWGFCDMIYIIIVVIVKGYVDDSVYFYMKDFQVHVSEYVSKDHG